jgi:DNA invertase Pin-like site-specific DNA recombinase
VKTVALYCRVSTAKQTNENQLPELRTFAARQGWDVICEYIDVVSGSGKKDRSQFQAMMLAASQRKFDLLPFWSLDRLSRRVSSKLWATFNSSRLGTWAGDRTRSHSWTQATLWSLTSC